MDGGWIGYTQGDLCDHLFSAKKFDFRPTRRQQHLSMVCDAHTTTFGFRRISWLGCNSCCTKP